MQKINIYWHATDKSTKIGIDKISVYIEIAIIHTKMA